LRHAIAHTQRRRGDPERKWSVPVSEREAARARLTDLITHHPRFPVAEHLYRTFVGESSSHERPPPSARRNPPRIRRSG
jgi:hypothetical protein